MARSWRYLLPVGLAGAVVTALAIADSGEEVTRRSTETRAASPAAAVASAERPSLTRWLAVGGGVEPGSNQVSIEQDLALVGQTLGPGGVTLFAGGAGRSPVQVLQTREQRGREGGLHRRLGDLFLPQDGRDASYRQTTLVLQGDARAETVLADLYDALEEKSEEPLFLFIAAHGEPGAQPHENLVRLWGGTPIGVSDLAQLLEEIPRPRPLRLLMATCFSGGFAELAFTGANPTRGATERDTCGLFATTWDTEAAGCDPNPDRRAQESYFLHLVHALAGHDRHGEAASRLDLDGDGRISLLEAHTRVRIASRSVSIPTSTSERWLHHAAGPTPSRPPTPLPELVEEHAVIAALGEELGLADEQAAQSELASLESQADELDRLLRELELELEVRSADLRIALLERWPVLDDPYHPRYAEMLAAHTPAIRTLLDDSPWAKDLAVARSAVSRHRSALERLDVAIAMTLRLLRAHHNLAAAAHLRAHAPDAFARYLEFLRCERSLPPLPAPG